MDIFLVFLGFILMLIGVLGSFLPVIPGPPLSWVGLLILHLTQPIPINWMFLSITLVIAIGVATLDYIIPAAGTKRFGGSKYGILGTTVGLLISFIFPVFGIFSIIVWPFIGAIAGELINKSDKKTAIKAAFGSFLGFLTGTFLKFFTAIVFLGLFISKVWEYRNNFFSF